MRRSSAGTETNKLQVTVDLQTDRMIGELASIGMFGTSKAEVSCSILRMWLWENQEKLRQNGVFVVQTESAVPRSEK